MSSQPTPARLAALEVIRRVFEYGAYADRALDAAARRHGAEGRERAFAQFLAYGAVRRRGTSDHLIGKLTARRVSDLDEPVRGVMRLAVFELLFASTPDHAAVDQAVELVKGAGARRATTMVNAALRRATRDRDSLLEGLEDSTVESASICHSYPEWLVGKWWSELGREDALALMRAFNEPAETALRVNTLRSDPERALESLRADGVEIAPSTGEAPLALAEGLVVDGAVDLHQAAAFRDGLVTPQSRASMAVVEILDPQPGDKVLDLCAAPGVKSTQIAARLGGSGRVIAVDRDSKRLSELKEMVDRLGAGNMVEAKLADATGDDLGRGYDRVLVDPPCSDLGTLASRPDVRWRKTPGAVDELVALQGRILDRGIEALGPGGSLVYSTCTISEPENAGRLAALAERSGLEIDDLGSRHPGLAAPSDSRFLQLRPDRDGTDGFFIARLGKRR